MTIEMAGQRALVPHFGSSTYVWTNVIGVILAALSVGYLVGGRLADRSPKPLILLGIVAGASLLCMLIPLVVHPLGDALIPAGTRQESAFRVVYLGSFLTTLLLMAPPIFLLGMVSPFTVRLLTREAGEVGSTSGVVYALSTVGSIFGTFLPTLVLVPSIGTSATILISAGALCVFAVAGIVLFMAGKAYKPAAFLLLPIIPAVLLSPGSVKGSGETLAEAESRYQYIRVYREGEAVILSLNEGLETYHSIRMGDRVLTGGSHFDYMNLMPLLYDPALRPRLRVFVAGLAAGVVSRQYHHFFGETFRLEVEGAEIDEEVLAMGRRFFALRGGENRNLRSLPMDARVYLGARTAAFDIVLVDAYANQMYIPFQLGSKEFFETARARMSAGAVLCLNAVDFTPDGPLLRAVRNTLADVFGEVHQIKVPGGMNYLLFCLKGGGLRLDTARANLERASFIARPEAGELAEILEHACRISRTYHCEPGGILLTDDFAPVESLMDASFRDSRRRMSRIDWGEE